MKLLDLRVALSPGFSRIAVKGTGALLLPAIGTSVSLTLPCMKVTSSGSSHHSYCSTSQDGNRFLSGTHQKSLSKDTHPLGLNIQPITVVEKEEKAVCDCSGTITSFSLHAPNTGLGG